MLWREHWQNTLGAIEGASLEANKGAYSYAWMIIFAVIAAIMVLIGLYHIRMLPSNQIPSTTKKNDLRGRAGVSSGNC